MQNGPLLVNRNHISPTDTADRLAAGNNNLHGLLATGPHGNLPNPTNIIGGNSHPSSATYDIGGLLFRINVQPKPILGIEQPELSERELAGIAVGISKLFDKAQQNNPSVSLKKEDGVTVMINPPYQGCRSLSLEFTL